MAVIPPPLPFFISSLLPFVFLWSVVSRAKLIPPKKNKHTHFLSLTVVASYPLSLLFCLPLFPLMPLLLLLTSVHNYIYLSPSVLPTTAHHSSFVQAKLYRQLSLWIKDPPESCRHVWGHLPQNIEREPTSANTLFPGPAALVKMISFFFFLLKKPYEAWGFEGISFFLWMHWTLHD